MGNKDQPVRVDQRDQRVAGKALEPVAVLVHRLDLEVEALFEGLDIGPDALESPPRRVSWHSFATLLNRLSEHASEEEFREAGRVLTETQGLGVSMRMTSLLASAAAVYATAVRYGLPSFFPMVRGSYMADGPACSLIDAHLPPDYTPCPAFFMISAGNFEVLPMLVGQKAARVDLDTDGYRGRFVVRHAVSRTLWHRLKGMWRALFQAGTVFDEMAERSEELARQLEVAAAARERAERAIAAQNTLLSAVSHELRTPLTAILGMLDLSSGDELPQTSREYMGVARSEANRLLHTLDSIVHVAALGDSAEDSMPEPTDLGAETRRVLEPYGKVPGVALHLTCPEVGEVGVLTPSRWVSTVLEELVSNAFKFTEQGEVRVRVEHEREGDLIAVRVAIKDTGCGIEPDWQHRIFEPFVQREGGLARGAEGVGLGLTVVKSLVDRLGGQLSLSSEPGRGTAVLVRLRLPDAEVGGDPLDGESVYLDDAFASDAPSLISDHPDGPLPTGALGGSAAVPDPAPVPQAERQPMEEPSDEAAEQERLLVVDDNPVNRLLMQRLGEKLGFVVTAAPGGQQALDALRGESFDLVFMDVQMPGMDGLEATRHIRDDERLCCLPVIAVTAQVAPGDEARCRGAGMDAYVPKPIDLEALNAAIDEARLAAAGRRLRAA